jgi:hypothetical protein
LTRTFNRRLRRLRLDAAAMTAIAAATPDHETARRNFVAYAITLLSLPIDLPGFTGGRDGKFS